jgi:N-hydroxyarylamine O-acetyltransferase
MDADNPSPLDLDAYLSRIGYGGQRTPTAAVLEEMHLAHATHIPFENLDIQLGRPIRLDLESLQAKLVHGRRGGYCFEQNALFAAALEQIGFRVTRLAARVRFGAARLLPRTHMLLRVEAEEQAWLADVGFGGEGLLKPLPLQAGQPAQQFARPYRLQDEAGLWVLQALHGGKWVDYYAFTLEAQLPVDYEPANWFTSTHPDSIFVRSLTAQRPTPEERYVLRQREFSVIRGDDTQTRTLSDDDELLRVLAHTFGLEFPSGTRFRSLT